MKKNPPKKWTLIFLLSAKNNLFNEQLRVINELYSVGSSNDVNLVLLFDAIEGDKFSKGFTAPSIYHIKKDTSFISDPCFESLSPSNQGLTNKKTLGKLLKIVLRDFKAEKYGFFYKGHGGPATTDISRGVFDTRMVSVDPNMSEAAIEKKYGNAQKGWDFEGFCDYPVVSKDSVNSKPILLIYSRGNSKSLLYSDLADALASVFKKKLDFICLDCCWAQQIENANRFVDLTNYFIASADEMPALGLGYTQLCTHFVNRPTIKAGEVANLLVSIYYYNNYADYESAPEYKEMGVSLTSICLSDFKKFIDPFKKLCDHFMERFKEKDDKAHELFKNARNMCFDYTYADTDNLEASKIDFPMFNIDLIWFLENLLFYNENIELEQKIFDVIYQIQNNLITAHMENNYKKTILGSKAIGGNGIAICFPVSEEHAAESILIDNKISFYKVTGWEKLLFEYYNYKPGQPMLLGLGTKGIAKSMAPSKDKSVVEDRKRLVFKCVKH